MTEKRKRIEPVRPGEAPKPRVVDEDRIPMAVAEDERTTETSFRPTTAPDPSESDEDELAMHAPRVNPRAKDAGFGTDEDTS